MSFVMVGCGGQEPFKYFQIGISDEEKEKNFERSDAIRDELIVMGISIMDTADGTVWEKA